MTVKARLAALEKKAPAINPNDCTCYNKAAIASLPVESQDQDQAPVCPDCNKPIPEGIKVYFGIDLSRM